ncbi:MAG: hypothetical protein AAFU85_28330 [Planctomycetota bacterium]
MTLPIQKSCCTIAAYLLALFLGSPAVQASLVGPSEAGFTQVYGLDIPNGPVAFNSSAIPYSVDNSGSIATGSFSRIAYHMELQRAGGPLQYVWVSVDAFTTDAGLIGVPSLGPNGNGGAVFQQNVSNMNVFSNQAGIVTGTGITTGNIEFWWEDYVTGNQAGVPGASGGLYDFGDQRFGNAGYGSMQIHNHGAGQTLFGFNQWGDSRIGATDLGIGNQVGGSGHPDWTFANNSGDYVVKTLEVWVDGQITAAVPEPTSASVFLGCFAVGVGLRRRRVTRR